MTKQEARRQTAQENTLIQLGFSREDAEALRRISMTLHRWHELECGTDHYCIVRGHWNAETQALDYDDNGTPFYEFAGGAGRARYQPIPDRETGSKKRLTRIMAKHPELSYYIQGDPRGAALYILRPGDVPDGQRAESYYTRGVVVY